MDQTGQTTMTTNTTLFASRPLWAGIAMALLAVPAAFAGDYSRASYGSTYGGYKGHHYSGGSYHGGHSYHSSKPAKTTVARTSPGRRYHYATGYRDGDGGFSWLRFNRGRTNNNGYSGSYASDNTPHRTDWEKKLRAQRKWDEEQYADMQGGKGDLRCGLSGAPAYCYRLEGPYPTELKVVRY